jgi:hypothetical protein
VLLSAVFILLSAVPVMAASPFADVPKNHWSYDAIEQLAADGFIAGYNNKTFNGGRPATRYEVASVVARALTKIDERHATKHEAELAKKLAEEFRTELEGLGIKSSLLDYKLSKLEKDAGGWKISGALYFDANYAGGDELTFTRLHSSRSEFNTDRLRFYLDKQIDENSRFHGEFRIGGEGTNYPHDTGMGDDPYHSWAEFYGETVLPYDINFRFGRFTIDLEDDYGFYADDDALFGDYRVDGFRLQKAFGPLTATAILGRNALADGYSEDKEMDESHTHYILDLYYQPNEKWFAGATAYWMREDSMSKDIMENVGRDWDVKTFALYGSYNFTDNIALKGIYYKQTLGDTLADGYNDKPTAWKAILDIKQDALKYTSLWVEYCRQDNNFCAPYNDYYTVFGGYCDRYVIGGSDSSYDAAGWNLVPNNGTTTWWFIRAEQQWTDKWSTYERFVYADLDTPDYANGKEYCVGVVYRINDAMAVNLLYSRVDHGTSYDPDNDDLRNGVDYVFRLRTTVDF